MEVNGCLSEKKQNFGGGEKIPPHSVGLASDVLPEAQSNDKAESSRTGVSIKCVHSGTNISKPLLPEIYKKRREEDIPRWYALRTTYGREKKAYDYMIGKGVAAFYPTQTKVKLINGKRKEVTESLLPNIFFAYGTLNQIKSFVYFNVNLPFLRFYYRHEHVGSIAIKTPLILPNYQMESLKIICEAEASDIIVSLSSVPNFQVGQMVRVIEGTFKGVVGRVKRWQGQQRVGVIIGDMATFATAYVSSAFLKKID